MSDKAAIPELDDIRQLPALGSEAIAAKWQDQNGHINVGYYMALYNECGWPMMDLIGIDKSYFTERNFGLVDLDNHFRYSSELHVGERVSVYGRFLAHDDKRIHGTVFIVNDVRDALACTIEFLSINFDLKKRRATTFPADVAAQLANITQQHRQLDWSPDVCQSLAQVMR